MKIKTLTRVSCFSKYLVEEKNIISLKRFHDAYPDIIIRSSKKGENKHIWGRRFSKAVAEFNIKNYNSKQPDWDEIEKKRGCDKRDRQEATSLSTPTSTSTFSTSTPSIPTTNKRWQVNEVDISEALLEYRKLLIEKCESTILDTHQEGLFINGIFLFNDASCVYPDSSLEYRVIIEQLKTKYPVIELLEKTKSIISKLRSYNECHIITKELSDDEDENNSHIQESQIKYRIQGH
ncbi:hypothetical protein BDC45DRAFT_531095 [Circinella umbellata]|nr:hypothetical protein BDC45DRAFT_531095 [Circinella umbellata]